MEEFKNCFPERVSKYLNEHKVSDVFKASVLVDDYVLTHKSVFVNRPFSNKSSEGLSGAGVAGVCDGPVPLDLEVKADKEEKDSIMCFYCKKRGHIVVNCPVLKKQNAKLVALET